MKKTFIFAFTFILLVGIIILGFNISDKTTIEKKKETTVDKNKIINIKMAHNLPENSALHEASVLFAKKIKDKTNNKVIITIYPKQELGNDHKMIELTRSGDIDILLTPTAKMSVIIPSMQYADLPFLFPTREDAYSLLDGEVGQIILKELNKIDLYGITFWENGFKHFTANQALLEPNDFIDKKIRIMKSKIIEEQFKALNAKPIPIDFHSTKRALSDKVVDGQENPLVAIVNMGFHDVQSDITLSEHAYLPYVFSISKKSLSKLSINQQEILINTAKEITNWEREETQKRELQFLDIIEKSGTRINKLTLEQKKIFAQKTSYIQKMYEDIIGVDIISKTEEELYNKYEKGNVVVIGVNADLSSKNKGSALAIKRGVELAVNDINKNGGLLGKKVIVIAKDHSTVSTKGIENVKEFIDDSNVLGIIGGKHSAIISSEIEHIQKGKIPYISSWAAASKIVNNGYSDNYIFRVSADDEFIVEKLWDESTKKTKRPLVIVENSIWGRGGLKNIEKYILKDNRNVDSILINRGETNFSKVIDYIQNEKIDSLLFILNSNEATKLVQELGIKQLKLPIISHWGIVGEDFFNTNKKVLQEIDLKVIQSFSLIDNNDTKSQAFSSSYLKKYRVGSIENINAVSGLAQAYDATNLLAIAIKNANTFDRKKIKEELENLEYYNGLIKEYNKPFAKTDHEALDKKDFFFSKFDINGNLVPIKFK